MKQPFVKARKGQLVWGLRFEIPTEDYEGRWGVDARIEVLYFDTSYRFSLTKTGDALGWPEIRDVVSKIPSADEVEDAVWDLYIESPFKRRLYVEVDLEHNVFSRYTAQFHLFHDLHDRRQVRRVHA